MVDYISSKSSPTRRANGGLFCKQALEGGNMPLVTTYALQVRTPAGVVSKVTATSELDAFTKRTAEVIKGNVVTVVKTVTGTA